MKNRKLLFFFSDEHCPSCATVVPTLAALAESIGYDFESYICVRPQSWPGKVLPAVGHCHLEQFYYLANFYDEIAYCSISSFGSYQFRREVLAFGGRVISERKNNEVFSFYRDVFSAFGKSLPETAVIVPDFGGDFNVAPYCYPDIQRLRGVGVSESVWKNDREKLLHSGVKKGVALYCAPQGAEVLDERKDDDTYASLTLRIALRNVDRASQIGFMDPNSILRWQAYFARKRILTVYEDRKWIPFVAEIKKLSDKVHNLHVIGTQNVYRTEDAAAISCCDNVISEMGRYNMIFNLLGVNPRMGFTLQTDKKLPLDWMTDPNVKTPWDDEYTDEFLLEKIHERAVPVCFLFYAADLGHLPVLSNFLNMMCLDGMRAGISFPSTWYDYQPELLEQLYIPLEQGGVCPNLEPLIASVGVAVATEAKGYLEPDFLKELISGSRKAIADAVDESRVPRGYYPFQDANPFYKKDTGEPQFDAVAELGFEYYITYKHSATRAALMYEGKGMTALNQQSPGWFPGYGNPLERLKEWEAQCKERRDAWKQGAPYDSVDWILFGFDTPFFGLTPTYLGEMESNPTANAGMFHIYKALQYVRRTGGADGSLFLVKPHELYRFAKLARKENLLREDL